MHRMQEADMRGPPRCVEPVAEYQGQPRGPQERNEDLMETPPRRGHHHPGSDG